MLRLMLAFLFLVFFFSPVSGAAPSLDVQFAKDKIHADETAELILQASWPSREGPYQFGIPTPILQNLKLINQGQSQETFLENGEEWVRKIFILQLSPEKAGEGRIEGFFITYLNPAAAEGGGAAQFEVKPLRIKIEKTALKIPAGLMGGLAGLLVFALMGAGIYIVRKKNTPPAPTFSQAAPLDHAVLQLQKPASDAAELSAIFREFLTQQYPSLSSKYSEAEMIRALDGMGLMPDEVRTLKGILETLGELRYMGVPAGETSLTQTKKAIVQFIESKRIVGSPA